jgi:hypothetical protein
MADSMYDQQNKFRGVRPHTRASAAAFNFVRSGLMGESKGSDLYKMPQFKAVESRVGKYHQNLGKKQQR